MRGFTLIETLVYIALLSFLVTGALATIYGIVESGAITSDTTVVHDEGTFVLRKVEWALASATSISSPASGSGSFLAVTQTDGTTINVRLSGDTIEMREDTGAYVPLTSENVVASSLTFTRLTGSPAGIEVTAVIDGVEFVTRRYLRE